MSETTAPAGRRKVSSGKAAAPPEQREPEARDRFPLPWGGVINDTVRIDVTATFRRLTADLDLGDGVGDYGAAIRALDLAARNAFDATRLTRAAKIADEEFAAQLDERLEVLRSGARKALEEEKAEAKRKGEPAKPPTLQEVEDRMVASWPDEVRSIRRRKAEMHGAFRSIEGLEESWRQRHRALEAIVSGFRGRG